MTDSFFYLFMIDMQVHLVSMDYQKLTKVQTQQHWSSLFPDSCKLFLI